MKQITLNIIHHANQYLLTENYENREGLSQIVQAFAGILKLHEDSKIPCGLHLSGTLIEAVAWGAPWFIAYVQKLRSAGLIEMIGGTYSENIMTLSDPVGNRFQIEEFMRIFDFHFSECEALKWFWVPERTWDTEKLQPLLQDCKLKNNGYRGIFLDQRHLFPIEAKANALNRAQVDNLGPWNGKSELLSSQLKALSAEQLRVWNEQQQMHVISDSSGLQIATISEHLRYWIPPTESSQLNISDLVEMASKSHLENPILFFADDMERIAGVGGWDHSAFERYSEFLEWIQKREDLCIRKVEIAMNPKPVMAVDAGAFYELEHYLGGGRNALGFTQSKEAQLASAHFGSVRKALDHAGSDGDPLLLELAQKHLAACEYETLWHDSSEQLAGWAKALASQSRHSLMMIQAALWFKTPDRTPGLEHANLFADEEIQIVLKNEKLFAVISPIHGGRLIALFFQSERGGLMMIGNPTDDWNLQTEPTRFMQIPANHPGAFAEIGGENDGFVASKAEYGPASAVVELENINSKSIWYGLRKVFRVESHAHSLAIDYSSVPDIRGESIISFSPDYLNLLRQGQRNASNNINAKSFWAAQSKNRIELRIKEGCDIKADKMIGHAWNARLYNMKNRFELEIRCQSDT